MTSHTITKAIIPVAGLGTRFLPATKAQPKEMLPIIDKPIIQFLVEEAAASGVTDIIFVTGRGKRAIEDHFDIAPELESALKRKRKNHALGAVRSISELARFSFVRQREPKGDGDALLAAAHLVGDEPVGVLYGDDVVEGVPPCLAQLAAVYAAYRAPVVALERVPRAVAHQYGIVAGEKVAPNLYLLTDVVEKPAPGTAPSNLAIVGKYIFTPAVFDALRRLQHRRTRKEYGTAHALRRMVKHQPIYGLLFSGTRYDCGSKVGFVKATIDFALKHPEVGPAIRAYLKSKKY